MTDQWIKDYFRDLFSSDATLGLNAWAEDGSFRGEDDGADYVVVVNDSDTPVPCPHCGTPLLESDLLEYAYLCEECNKNFYESETSVPTYEIRIRRIN